MAKIHAVLTKQESESVAVFKERCGAILATIDAGAPAVAVGRFTLTPDGLDPAMQWGQAHEELPSETCVIASYDQVSAKLAFHPYSVEEFNSAPRNPDLAQPNLNSANTESDEGVKAMPEHVIRYVVTHIDKNGMRTLCGAAQGRFTQATPEEAQQHLDAMLQNNRIEGDRLAGVYGLPLEVRPVKCYPRHFDPMGIYFDNEHILDDLLQRAEIQLEAGDKVFVKREPEQGDEIERGTLRFKVSYEATGFTNSKDLLDRTFTEQEAIGFSEVSLQEGTLPTNVLAVLGGHVSADDGQGEKDIHVFVCVDLLVEASSEDAAERMAPPKELLTRISDLMSSGLDLDLQAHSWEVTQVQTQDEALADAVQNRIDQLPALIKGAGPAYTLAVVAQDAIATAGGDATKVDWAQVDRMVIETAMRTNQQPAERVLEVLQAHSPGTVTQVGQQAVASLVQEMSDQAAGRAGMTNAAPINRPPYFVAATELRADSKDQWIATKAVTLDGAKRVAANLPRGLTTTVSVAVLNANGEHEMIASLTDYSAITRTRPVWNDRPHVIQVTNGDSGPSGP
jgi:hypothetical protein